MSDVALALVLIGIPALAIMWFVGRKLIDAAILVFVGLDARWRK